MKKLILASILAALVTAGTTVIAQNYSDGYLGLPGDNLNLYAVMKLFQESQTLEGFERSLNDENSRINNLDLNGDNMVDYITVNDYVDGNVHTIVLRTILSRNESQDVAVFIVQQFRDGSVQIQLVGDEELYGRNYIIEPIFDDNYAETPNPGYNGRSPGVTVVRTTFYEVAAWPVIRFIYLPDYVVWRPSWYWGYYPSYWNPWHPYYWHYYYGYHYHWHNHYYAHYRHWDHHRYSHYNDSYYRDIRSHSPMVSARIKEGNYRNTYSHPEKRREGEALYNSLHSGQNTGRSVNTSYNSQRSRPESQSASVRSNEHVRASTTRHSVTTVNRKSVNSHTAGQQADISGRSSASASNKHRTKSTSVKSANVSQRSTTSVKDKPAARSSSGYKDNISRRSAKSVNDKNAFITGNNANVPRRSATNVKKIPSIKSSPGKNVHASSGSFSGISNRHSSRPEQVRRGETTRSSGSSTKSAGSAGNSNSR